MDDSQEDFINLKDREFVKIVRQKPNLVYKILKKAAKPIYSGSIDHRTNMLDTQKMKAAFNNKQLN